MFVIHINNWVITDKYLSLNISAHSILADIDFTIVAKRQLLNYISLNNSLKTIIAKQQLPTAIT